jgi:chorismate synthase
MTTFRYLTAGESHGAQLTAIIDGCPAGLRVTEEMLDRDLARRQGGYGRGARQAIERDHAQLLSGVRYGHTTSAPITLVVANRDAANWGDVLAVGETTQKAEPVTVARPGHADLMGAVVYERSDLRDVIERASARETAARVACGGVARALLAEIGCLVASHVVRIGDVVAERPAGVSLQAADDDPVRCLDREAGQRMCRAIDAAAAAGDTLGGIFEIVASGYPPGVGSYAQADRRLGAVLAAALMSVPAVKGVEIGLGFGAAELPGSTVHDEIMLDADRNYARRTNRAGGIEGGISTGEALVVRAAMKPIATLRRPLSSLDLATGEVVDARFERSDVCAVPAAAVVGEAVVALALAGALVERVGAATVAELVAAVAALRARNRRP